MKLPLADCRLPLACRNAAVAQTGSLLCRRLATCGGRSAVKLPIDSRVRRRRASIFHLPSSIFADAFTLIEIMIVVGIIGLLAAMGAPALNKMLQKEGMRKALSDIEDVCFSAREQAIVFNKTTAVVFYPRERRFEVDGGGGGGGINVHSGKVTSATLPEGVELGMLDIFRRDYVQSDWAKIYFNSDGTCDEAVIVLIAKGQSEKITLEYATGMPTVSPVDQ
jgi:prepilin-type N-terminal cleavage/methylation domain-containing protein